jgi:hypothetical protein
MLTIVMSTIIIKINILFALLERFKLCGLTGYGLRYVPENGGVIFFRNV